MVDIAHYAPLFPEALLTGIALLIILLGLFVKSKGLMGYLSLAGLVAALAMVAGTAMIPKPAVFFFDSIQVDGVSQFFNIPRVAHTLLDLMRWWWRLVVKKQAVREYRPKRELQVSGAGLPIAGSQPQV